VEAIHADSPVGHVPTDVDRVLYRPFQRAAKPQVFEWIDAGFAHLKIGGRICLFGRKDRGVMSYAQRLQAVFGNTTRGSRIGKGRVFWAQKETSQACVAPAAVESRFEVDDLPGGSYRFVARAGAFSRDGVDPGSRLLIENLRLAPRNRVLDLGCGWGLLGIVCARLAPKGQVRLADVSFRAVSCARENLKRNGIDNARAAVADGCEGASGTWDVIVSNPPFHEGNAVGNAFIDGAFRLLGQGGRMMVVVMRAAPYLRHMREYFRVVETVAQRDGYSVLLGET